jgi:hypothetical protein
MLLAAFLAILIGLPAPAFAQQAPPPPQAEPAPATVETLKLLVLQGQNAINGIRDGLATMPVVEVHDENDQVLEGADVVFELPATGAGGTFPEGGFVKTVKSNLQGQAGAAFMPNPVTGRFTIKVTASLRNRTGHTTITQTNALDVAAVEKAGKHKITWWKLAIVGGAVALVIGIVLATRGGSSSSSSNTITLTPGAPTFGTP